MAQYAGEMYVFFIYFCSFFIKDCPTINHTTKQWKTPGGQKPSGIIGLPTGMYFLTVNRQELTDRTPASGKSSLP